MVDTAADSATGRAAVTEPVAGPAAEAAAAADEIVSPSGPHGYSHDKESHLKRLRRIEGQIRGLQRMVEQDVYCIDILTQVSASTKGLQSFALQLLEEHLRHCVAAAAVGGGPEIDEKVAEATAAIARLLRT
ncbi:metal-sensitive transcriptional regulator [Actinacidiphila epipremni]|jgi:DNA-binding FrmR family transcriptional regulator|uniref:Metal-sensitive transcriptional regulator n=1 Tax=Actinacidiphila epipremni TaxID=2053013 RepID=A0ABX0ZSM8_9ACTN|nr:metal-sensitive transcriptional regulator [Actinacidiphila epipremni]NJP46998.1 metal-sensitive transcriptional regulator [Actinacidiphila epipremni]